MTQRVKGLVVTLDQDYREDDMEAIAQAIRMVRGVADVALDITEDHMADTPSRHENAFIRILDEVTK